MIEILITKGQIVWIFGVIFISVGVIFLRKYFTSYWYGTIEVDDADKIGGLCFIFAGLLMIFLGVNSDFNLIDFKVVD